MNKTSKIVLISVYFGVAIIVLIISIATHNLTPHAIGEKLIVTGIGIAVIAFVSFNEYGGRGAISYVTAKRNRKEFMAWRARRKPVRDIILAVVYAAALITVTGIILVFL